MPKFIYIGGEGAPENDTLFGHKVGQFGDEIEVGIDDPQFAVIARHHWFQAVKMQSGQIVPPPIPPQGVVANVPLPDPHGTVTPPPLPPVEPAANVDPDPLGHENAFEHEPETPPDLANTVPVPPSPQADVADPNAVAKAARRRRGAPPETAN